MLDAMLLMKPMVIMRKAWNLRWKALKMMWKWNQNPFTRTVFPTCVWNLVPFQLSQNWWFDVLITSTLIFCNSWGRSWYTAIWTIIGSKFFGCIGDFGLLTIEKNIESTAFPQQKLFPPALTQVTPLFPRALARRMRRSWWHHRLARATLAQWLRVSIKKSKQTMLHSDTVFEYTCHILLDLDSLIGMPQTKAFAPIHLGQRSHVMFQSSVDGCVSSAKLTIPVPRSLDLLTVLTKNRNTCWYRMEWCASTAKRLVIPWNP